MTALRGTMQDSLDWATARLGFSRTSSVGRDWTPSTTIDDCALFQSAVLYGDYGTTNATQWDADGFKSTPLGTYHPGKSGLHEGDVVLYDWDGNGIANHVEFCVTPPNAAGTFQTIGVNGSDTIADAYRWRNGYVLGYFRPNYVGSSATASSGTTTDITDEEDDMFTEDDRKAIAQLQHDVTSLRTYSNQLPVRVTAQIERSGGALARLTTMVTSLRSYSNEIPTRVFNILKPVLPAQAASTISESVASDLAADNKAATALTDTPLTAPEASTDA
jgi:hypothetical protein